jgi:hypothetical protein
MKVGDMSMNIWIILSFLVLIAILSSNPDTGSISVTHDSGWLLNPKSTFPLTVYGINRSTAEELKRLLDGGFSLGNDAHAKTILPIIIRSNLRWKEIDEYIRKFKPQYLGKIEELKRSSKKWTSVLEKDREDLLTRFRQQALESIDVRPYGDLAALFEYDPVDSTSYKALIDRFGYENIRSYLISATDTERIWIIPADSLERSRFEELVRLRLAIRGADIDPFAILNTLRLQDMNSLLTGLTQAPFTRKAKAIEFLTTLPDLKERLAKVESFHVLFQLRPLPDEFSQVNWAQFSVFERYVKEVATIIAHTYVMGGYASRRKDEDGEYPSNITGWELDSVDDNDACPYCRRAAAKTYPKNQRPKTPLHIGCRCGVIPMIKDYD